MGLLYNRAKMSVASAPGTGTVSLGSAVAGYQSFAAAGVTDQQVVSYVIEDGTAWEYGQGTYTASGTTLARTTIQGSSNSGSAISASSGASVFISPLATDIAVLGNNNTWTGKQSYNQYITIVSTCCYLGYTNVVAQGCYFGWNRNSGDGGAWIINQKGGGGGGINLGESDTSNNYSASAFFSPGASSIYGTLSITAPGAGDNSSKAPTTAWVNNAIATAGATSLSSNNTWTGVNYYQNITYLACASLANSSSVPNGADRGLAVQWNYTQGYGEIDLISLYSGNPSNTGFNFYGKTSSTAMVLVATLAASGALFPYGATTVAPGSGDSSTRVPTTAWVNNAIATAGATSLGASGYTKLANGLILQWTTLTTTATTTTWAFPVAFPSACLGAYPTPLGNTSAIWSAWLTAAPGKTSAVIESGYASSGGGISAAANGSSVYIYALGY